MSAPGPDLRSRPTFWSELKRRHVIRVALAYIVVGTGIGSGAEVFLENLGAPEWLLQAILMLIIIGFPIAVALAWIYQRTARGVIRDVDWGDAGGSPVPASATGGGEARDSLTDSIASDRKPTALRPGELSGIVLAVLPFDNLSNDPEMQFFSDGVSEEIIQRLSRGANLKLIGRTSSFQFRGVRKAEAARTLNCSHVLDGSIRRAANRIRISAQLVEATSGNSLWSDRYDRELEDIFAVQDDISENIAGALDQAFSSFSTQKIDPAVYDLYLRASLKSYAPDELRTNIGLLEVATQRAPQFKEAWARLAYSRAWLRFYQPFAQRATSTKLVMREAERALELDPQNVDALCAQLFVIAPFGRFLEADEALERIRKAPGVGDGKSTSAGSCGTSVTYEKASHGTRVYTNRTCWTR